MGYELQYLFRQIERGEIREEDHPYLEQVLNVINHYQGEELQELRDNFVALFSQWESGQTVCPLLASSFTNNFNIQYNAENFIDLLFDSDIPTDPADSMDSIVYYLEYFSVLCDEYYEGSKDDRVTDFYNHHLIIWIPQFCDLLFRTSNISFYKEIAIGLNEYLLQTGILE
jgi:TorA maturation chaperone TorD